MDIIDCVLICIFFQLDIKDQVFHALMYFLRQDDEDIQNYTLKAIGFICIRHYEFMLENELKKFYHNMLIVEDAPLKMKSEVLMNIEMYLMEEENRMIKLDQECRCYECLLNICFLYGVSIF